MSAPLLTNLLIDILEDLRHPGVIWQLATIALCLAAGWLLARAVRARFANRQIQSRAVRLGVDSFAGVLSPVFMLILILIAKPLLGSWQHNVNLLRVAIPLTASFALIRFAFYIMRRVFAREGTVGKSLHLFEKLFAAFVWLGFALYITGLWPDLIAYLETTQLPFGRAKVSLAVILQAVASVVITLMAALWIGTALEERLMQVDTLHSSLRVVMSRMMRAVLILLAVLFSLSLVGIDLTVLSVFGGALGVGLGLGLQKVASNYVSGFIILLDRSLAIGDLITVDKYSGKVTRINTRYTILQGLDGIDSVIPNEMLVSSPVQNYSLTTQALRLSTQVNICYEADIEMVLPLLSSAAAGIARVLAEPAPQAMLVKFIPEGLVLEVGFWIADPVNGRMSVISDVNREIWRILREHKISVPYPQRTPTPDMTPVGCNLPAGST